MSTEMPIQDDPYVVRSDKQGVATLTLNRPQQFNSLSQAMIAALQAQIDAIAPDPAVRVLVIAGAGASGRVTPSSARRFSIRCMGVSGLVAARVAWRRQGGKTVAGHSGQNTKLT